MRTLPLGILWVYLLSNAVALQAQPESEIDVLRTELAQMRVEYESRIALLEQRLDEAEKKAVAQENVPAQPAQQAVAPDTSWQPDPYTSQGRDNGNTASLAA